ncbi:MAG TPA: lysophospholipid acyltransferase family protein [Capsulimonadaceae bacterium]|jgi:1-acyl-sn-glycerol-3-phosphate acyltransferase
MTTPEETKSTSSLPPPDRRPDKFNPYYPPVRETFRAIFTLLGGIKVVGAEYIPATGGVIVAPNHTSMVDPPLMACAVKRPLRYMTKAEMFKVPVIGPLCIQLGGFPVVRGTADRGAIRKALSVLANGEVLIIFPEGNRGDGVTLQEAEKGAAMIAIKSGVPIVPCYIDGSSKMLGKGKSFPSRARLTVRFGPAIDAADYAGKGGIDRLGPDIMAAIGKLRDDHYGAAK